MRSRPSYTTVAGLTFRRSIVGWVGQIGDIRVRLMKHDRTHNRGWVVMPLWANAVSACYGRGNTMVEAVEQAKACPLLATATTQGA